MLEGFAYRALRDFVKGHALDTEPIHILIFSFFLLFLLVAVRAEFVGKMRRDGFAFTVRVRREINVVCGLGQLLQLTRTFSCPE